jgi:hypothetical protein
MLTLLNIAIDSDHLVQGLGERIVCGVKLGQRRPGLDPTTPKCTTWCPRSHEHICLC